MSYSSSGPKPYERASKSAHSHIINDPAVAAVLGGLYVPPQANVGSLKDLLALYTPEDTKIQHIVAIDGGYTEVPLRVGFPSATLHFFQFGALHFRREDLKRLEQAPHVAPEDIQKLKNIDRLKLPLATKGARSSSSASLAESVRNALWSFCRDQTLGESNSLLDTLAWFLFSRYLGFNKPESSRKWFLSSNPYGVDGGLALDESQMSKDFTFVCPSTGRIIYLTDVFRLHERIEEETGAASVASYIAGAIEHLILLHIIKNLIGKDPGALRTVLFILDRPTGWFGLTAPLHKPMLALNSWLFDKHALFLVGLEKSGAFVDHARDLQPLMPAGSFLILNDEYIYRHISPGEEDPNRPYAGTSYYGHKLIFKSRSSQMYVASLPVRQLLKNPGQADIPNLNAVLTHLEELHCDMYDSALLPIALANKLVSLSAHPSTQILRNFVKATVPGQ